MKNNTNIYDIDDKLIRKAGDNHRFTIDEVKLMINQYYDKIKELTDAENPSDEDVKKIRIYQNYIRNLSYYQWQEMSKLSQAQLAELFAKNTPTETTEDDKTKALEELNEVVEEQKPVSQEDLLVEREDSPTKMDEYVPFEES